MLSSRNNAATGSDDEVESRLGALVASAVPAAAAAAPLNRDVEQVQIANNDNHNDVVPENETLPPPPKQKKKNKTKNKTEEQNTAIPVPPHLTTPMPPDKSLQAPTIANLAQKLADAQNLPVSASHLATATERMANLRQAFITARRERTTQMAHEKEKNVCIAPLRPPHRYKVTEWGEEEVDIGPVAPKHWTDDDLNGLCGKALAEFDEKVKRNKEEGWTGQGAMAAIGAARMETTASASQAPRLRAPPGFAPIGFAPTGFAPPGFTPSMAGTKVEKGGANGQWPPPPPGFSSQAPPPSDLGFKVPPTAEEKPEPIMSDRPPAPGHPVLPWRTVVLGQKPIWTVTMYISYPRPRTVRIGECGTLNEAMGFYAAFGENLKGKEIGVFDPTFVANLGNEKAREGDVKPMAKFRVTGRMQIGEWGEMKEVAKEIKRDILAGFDTVLQTIGRNGEVERAIEREMVVMRCWIEKLGEGK